MRRSAFLLALLAVSSCHCGQNALLFDGPHAEVTPAAATDASRTLAFGDVGVGSKKLLNITVTNDGNRDLSVTPALDAASDSSFEVTFAVSTALTVHPGDTLNLPVQFAPLQLAAAKGTITLATDSVGADSVFTILLRGNGVNTTLQLCKVSNGTETCDDALAAGTNLQVDFGEPAIGAPVAQAMLLRAKGAAINVSSISLLSSSDPDFSATGLPTLPLAMQPGDVARFTVTYSAMYGGVASGTLEVLSDATSRPRDHVDLTGKADAPRLCIPAADLAFGDISVNQTKSKTAHLTNCGLEPLTISSIAPTGPEFALGGAAPSLPITLTVGAVLPVNFTFHPTMSGAVQHPLSIGTNEPHPGVFLQSGNGVRCTLDLQPVSTLAFGTVPTGSSVTMPFLMLSVGDSACTVTALNGPTGTAGFTLPSPPTLPLVMPPGLIVSVDVTFTPTSAGAASATLGVVSNDAAVTTQNLHLTASGTAPPPCLFTAVPSPAVFGNVAVGSSATQNVVITNSGTDDCYIQNSGVTGDTSFTATFPAALPPNPISSHGSITVPVKYTPASAATHAGLMTVTYANQQIAFSGISTLKVNLTGGALVPKMCLTPTTLDFGTVAAGAMPTKTIAIQSCGAGPLTIRGVPFGAGTSSDFKLLSPPSLPLVLQPNAIANLTVQFSPTNSNGVAGTLDVLSNDPALPSGVVQLRGNLGTCMTQIVCNPMSIDFPGTQVGRTSAKQVNCTNAGNNAVTITGAAISTGADADISLLAGQFPITLQVGDVLRAQVQFAPTAPSAGAATFTLQTGGCGNGTIAVTALGTAPVLPKCPPLAAFTPKTKWAWNGSPSASDSTNLVMTPAVVNLTDDNHDGAIDENDIPDIVFASCSSLKCCANCLDPQHQENADVSGIAILHAVSGKDASEEWTLTDPNLQVPAGAQIAVADLNGDGIPEIIAVQHAFRTGVACPGLPDGLPVCGKYITGNLEILDHNGKLLFLSEPWNQPTNVIENESAILVADLDQDGSPEIIFGDTVFDSTGHMKWRMSKTVGDNGHGTWPIAADVDGDGKLEVIAGPTAYRADGTVLWTASGYSDGLALIADVDGDGKPEVILRPSTNQLIILNGATGAKIREIDLPTGSPSGIDSNACPAGPSAADFLGIGSMQIAVPAGNWFYLVRADTGAVIWQQAINDYDGQCGASGAAAFSFFGDGKADIVYHDTQSIFVWRGDGTLVYKAPRASSTLFETPVIADVDNDGHAEILITNQGIGGTSNGLTCLSDANNSWPATRRIWGQWNYHVTDFNENGTIPRVERPFWKTSKLWRGNPAQCVPR
jgi:hypothetical protein